MRGVTVRLCAGAQSDRPDGPFVLVGEHEFTLYEAEVLIGALTQLVDLAGSNVGRADPEDPPRIHSPSHA